MFRMMQLHENGIGVILVKTLALSIPKLPCAGTTNYADATVVKEGNSSLGAESVEKPCTPLPAA